MAGIVRHPIIHIELSAKNRGKLAAFYDEVFGWTAKDFPEMDYTTFVTGADGPGGGYNPVNDSNPEGTVLVYVGTNDIDGDLKAIEKGGGKVIVPRSPIPGTGWFAVFEDPSGNRLGLLEGYQPQQ